MKCSVLMPLMSFHGGWMRHSWRFRLEAATINWLNGKIICRLFADVEANSPEFGFLCRLQHACTTVCSVCLVCQFRQRLNHQDISVSHWGNFELRQETQSSALKVWCCRCRKISCSIRNVSYLKYLGFLCKQSDISRYVTCSVVWSSHSNVLSTCHEPDRFVST